MENTVDRIRRFRKERNAVILAHYYENPEIQDIADIVGDSFELARRAQHATEDVMFCAGFGLWPKRQNCSIPEKPCCCRFPTPGVRWPTWLPRRRT
jgi:quinolinate synthase